EADSFPCRSCSGATSESTRWSPHRRRWGFPLRWPGPSATSSPGSDCRACRPTRWATSTFPPLPPSSSQACSARRSGSGLPTACRSPGCAASSPACCWSLRCSCCGKPRLIESRRELLPRVPVPQHAFLHFAHGIARQLGRKVHPLWHLEAGELRLEGGDEVILGEPAAGAGNDHRGHGFTEI